MPSVPVIPGDLVPRNSDQESWLKIEVARLCQTDHHRFVVSSPNVFGANPKIRNRFPGSQPVSFGSRDLDKLETQEYARLFVSCLLKADQSGAPAR